MNENFFESSGDEPDYYPPDHRGRKHFISGDKLPQIDPESIQSSPEQKDLYASWLKDTKEKLGQIEDEKSLEQKQRESRERSQRLALIRGVADLSKKYDTKPPSQESKPLSPRERGELPDW